MSTVAARVAGVCAVMLLAGCGVNDPYASTATTSPSTQARTAPASKPAGQDTALRYVVAARTNDHTTGPWRTTHAHSAGRLHRDLTRFGPPTKADRAAARRERRTTHILKTTATATGPHTFQIEITELLTARNHITEQTTTAQVTITSRPPYKVLAFTVIP